MGKLACFFGVHNFEIMQKVIVLPRGLPGYKARELSEYAFALFMRERERIISGSTIYHMKCNTCGRIESKELLGNING